MPESTTDPETAYCGHCGERGRHRACEAMLALEPPRYCTACRRRMKVQVLPRGWSATCVEHGTVGPAATR